MAQPLYAQAMKSKYTKLLLENFLLSPYEMTDPAIMAGLQKNVYPKGSVAKFENQTRPL